jgi:hypothetical protein
MSPSVRIRIYTCVHTYPQVKLEQMKRDEDTLCLFEVKVGIVAAKDLPRMDTFGNSDPYVKIQLEKKTKKTKIIKNTLYPEWNEYFILPVTNLSAQLVLTMYDWNRFGSHEFIGTASIPIGKIDESEQGSDKWYELEEDDTGAANGVLRVRLQWRKNEGDPWSELPEVEEDDLGLKLLQQEHPEALNVFHRIGDFFRRAAESSRVNHFMNLVLVLNIIVMAMEYDCSVTGPLSTSPHDCTTYKVSLEGANIVFITLFFLEFVVKMVGLGPINYFKEGLNVMDFVVVCTGFLEATIAISVLVCFSQYPDLNPFECGSTFIGVHLAGIRLVRLARVLRIQKLLRSFPHLRRQITDMVATAYSVSSVVFLMVIVIVLFAIIGMNIFGGHAIDVLEFQDDINHYQLEIGAWVRAVIPGDVYMRTCRIERINATATYPFKLQIWGADTADKAGVWATATHNYDPYQVANLSKTATHPMIIGLVPRNHFDGFWSACITAFQILTLSDFHKVWYACVRGTNIWGSLYFIMLIFFGNFMLLNLFTAIIIQVCVCVYVYKYVCMYVHVSWIYRSDFFVCSGMLNLIAVLLILVHINTYIQKYIHTYTGILRATRARRKRRQRV